VLATEPLPSDDVLTALSGVTSRTLQTHWNGPPLRLYSLPAGTRVLGETLLPAPTPDGAVGNDSSLHLAAYEYRTSADGTVPRLLLRWSGPPPAPAPAAADLAYWRGALPGIGGVGSYTFALQPVDADGAPLGPVVTANCPVMHWGAGEDVYTWITLPTTAHVVSWRVSVARQLYALVRPQFGPLALESADLDLGPVERLPGTTTVPAPNPIP
jgi:hypothetical protein